MKFATLFVVTWLITALPGPIWAAQVKAVVGKRAQVDMQDDTFKVGDVLKVENKTGKTVGLIKVKKIQDKIAEGPYKGKIEKDQAVSLRPAKVKKPAAKREQKDSKSSGKNIYGIMLGYNMTNADVKLPQSGTTVALDGTGFSLKGFFDYPLFSILGFRGLFGVEQFNVGGQDNALDCGGECTAEITYLSLDLWGRLTLSDSAKMRLWAGGGMDFMVPMSKEATALDEGSITNTSLFAAGGGVDWKLAAGAYLAFQLEYHLYPSSEDVKANAIAVRGGYAKSF